MLAATARTSRATRRLVALVTVCAVVLGAGGLPASAQVDDDPRALTVPAIGAPGSTGRISLIGSQERDGWRYDQYRNTAYPCAVSGYNTFTIGTKLGTPTTDFKPLWVYMHGGGFGYFDDTGTPQPSTQHMVEETADRQIRFLTGGDSSRGGGILVSARSSGRFRMLEVSMCGHDGYGGANVADPNNPNTTPDGKPRTVNGLYATKAAIDFARRTVRTDDIVLHGTSAGSFGAWHVAWGLTEQGIPPTAIIADSGILSRARTGWLDEDPGCGTNSKGAASFRSRLHPAIIDPANEPDDLITTGRITSPVLDLWVGNDPYWCGDTPVRCPVDDGPDVNLGATDCMHEGVRRAIEAQGPGSRSLSRELCVDEPAEPRPPTPPEDCDRHVPSVVSASGTTYDNSLGPWPADYRTRIMAWVDARLADDRFRLSDFAGGLSFANAAVTDLLLRTDEARAEALAREMVAGASKRTVLDRLTRSDEWLEAIVQDLYRTTLGREGDAGSVAYWVDELASGRRTVANVTASFYASPDYFNRNGKNLEAWVGAVYRAVLGRSPSATDTGYWAGQARRRGRTVVALALFQSSESAGDRVAVLYDTLLGRAPSASDITYWSPRIKAQGDLALATSLALSSEYQLRADRRFP